MSDVSAPVAESESVPERVPVFAPISLSERIASIDVLRGVALLGILLMNITAFGLPLGAYSNPAVSGGAEGVDLASWVVTETCFEGTFRTIFSMLFGAGVLLFMTRAEKKCNTVKAADLYFRRNVWLIVFGVIHAYLLLWIGEILYGYGVTALVLFAFRNMGPRKLLIAGLLVLAVLVPKRIHHAQKVSETYDKYVVAQAAMERGQVPTPQQLDAISAWRAEEVLFRPTPDDVKQEIDLHLSDYWTNLTGLASINVLVQANYYYLWNFWDCLGAMFVGLALFKFGVFSVERPYALYVSMVLIGYGIGLTVNILETKYIIDSGFDMMAFNRAHYTYDLGRLAMTAGHIGVVMLICKGQVLSWLRMSLAAVGRMALTNYIMHTLICVTFFSGFGFGMYAQLQRHQLYYVVLSIWILQLIVSPIWLSIFQCGPLEWMWRSLTYWRMQPMLRHKEVAEAVL